MQRLCNVKLTFLTFTHNYSWETTFKKFRLTHNREIQRQNKENIAIIICFFTCIFTFLTIFFGNYKINMAYIVKDVISLKGASHSASLGTCVMTIC